MQCIFSSAFVLIVCGTLVLLFKYKAVSLITGHISLVLDKINLHLTLLIFKNWFMSSLSVPEVSWSPPVLPASVLEVFNLTGLSHCCPNTLVS